MKKQPRIFENSFVILLHISFLLTAFGIAQDRGVGIKVKTDSGQIKNIELYRGSYALVIGNTNYINGWDSLAGVKSDVVAVRDILTKHGFLVETAEDLTGEEFLDRVNKFIRDYGFQPDNRLLIYYAGHGHTLGSTGDARDLGYLVPVDAPDPKKDDLGFKQKAIPMDEIQNFAKKIQAKHALFLFDSCFSGKLITRSAITVPPVIEEKVAYAVRQFITAGAADQPVPDESIFRRSFVRGLEGEADRNRDGYITGTELAEYLKEEVTNYSRRTQTPQYGKIADAELNRGDFVFVTEKGIGSVSSGNADPNSAERATWNLIKESEKKADYELFLESFPKGIFATQAKANYEKVWWESIKSSSDKTEFENFLKKFPVGPYAVGAKFAIKRIESAAPKAGALTKSKLPNGIEMSFAYIPAGEFQMGSDSKVRGNEHPIHTVNISRPFWMGIYEVTQEQWQAVMGTNPSNFQECGEQCPVEQVSWEDVQEFIKKLNATVTDGFTYRLPTEAEWEYAARAGTTGDYAGDLFSMAWYFRNSGEEPLKDRWHEKNMKKNKNRTHPVGQKSPNAWGLHDMHGNVWEWVEDGYGLYPRGTVTDPLGPDSAKHRVVRGGSWYNTSQNLRSARRGSDEADKRLDDLGFRLVRVIK